MSAPTFMKAPPVRAASPAPKPEPEPVPLFRSCACESSPEPCASCDDDEARLQRDADPGVAQQSATHSVNGVIAGSGQPLPADVRSRLEARLAFRFGSVRVAAANTARLPQRYSLSRRGDSAEREADATAAQGASHVSQSAHAQPDLSAVRIHVGGGAADAARGVAARAFTLGNHIVFASGQYSPHTPGGERLLAHELTHVLQTGGRVAGRIQRDEAQVLPKPPPDCEDETDITQQFKRFVTDSDAIVGRMTGLSDDQRDALKGTAKFVFSAEGKADLNKFKVFRCKVIRSRLASVRESIGAEVDAAKKELRLGKFVADQMEGMLDPQSKPDKEQFVNVLQTLQHEKRHVTLGNLLAADPAALRPDLDKTTGGNLVQYRAEEILATIDEAGIGALALGKDYAMPVEMQQKLYRQRNMIRNFSSDAEWKRLRKIILKELRNRFAKGSKCDTKTIIGLMRSMDRGSWFDCNAGRIIGDIPEDVSPCEKDGKHVACDRP